MKKTFPIESVLSASSGILVCDSIDGVYDVMSFILNQPLMTHQLPAAFDICQPAIESQHPWIALIEFPAGDTEKIKRKLSLIKKRYGDELEIEQLKDTVRIPFTAGLEKLGQGRDD